MFRNNVAIMNHLRKSTPSLASGRSFVEIPKAAESTKLPVPSLRNRNNVSTLLCSVRGPGPVLWKEVA